MKPTPAHDHAGLWTVATSLVGATLLIGVAAQLYALPDPGALPPRPVIDPHVGLLSPPPPPAPMDPGLPPPLAAPSEGGAVTVSARLDRTAVLEGQEGIVQVELTLAAAEREAAEGALVPTDLVVVVDRSSSMGGEKILAARQAIVGLIDTLGDADRFALVSYSDVAEVTIPMETATAAHREAWRSTAQALGVGGSTNISAALELATSTVEAWRQDGRAPRILLLSDGQATAGDQSLEGLTQRARRASTREYVLSTLGIGQDHDEALMTRLADAGTGNYYYLGRPEALAAVFDGEFAATRLTVASGVTVRVEAPAGVQLVDAGGFPLTAERGAVSFVPGAMFSGQRRQIWLRYRVPTVQTGELSLGAVRVAYVEEGERRSTSPLALATVYCVDDPDVWSASVDKEVWEEAVVNDSLAQLKLDVAAAVRAGDVASAQAHIDGWGTRTQALNEKVGSAKVADAVTSLEGLKASVDQVFQGQNQASRQKVLSKTFNAEGYDGRRAGNHIY